MRKNSGGITVLAALALVASLLSAAPARAVMLVEESTALNHREGSKIDDEAVLTVPEGAKLRLFLVHNGQTYVVRGPFTGTLAEYRKKRGAWWRRVFGKFWSNEPGDLNDLPGGVRSVTPKQQ
ncbi:MAG: hypothetical protein SGJ17_10455 [Hyphomicrobiales bacterium]|nr:hypothetical protein [Hyphomicrobiales bacterium]